MKRHATLDEAPARFVKVKRTFEAEHGPPPDPSRTCAARVEPWEMDSSPQTAAQRRQAERGALPPTDDDRSWLVGMDRPATPDELRAFVAREQLRIARERGAMSVPSSVLRTWLTSVGR